MPSRRSVLSVSITLAVIVAFRLASPHAVSTVPEQRSVGRRVGTLLKVGNLSFKDLNRNGVLDRYEDWRLPLGARVTDLLSRMTLEEKAGLMQITSFNADSMNEYINQRHIRYLILRATTLVPVSWRNARTLVKRSQSARGSAFPSSLHRIHGITFETTWCTKKPRLPACSRAGRARSAWRQRTT